MYQEFRHFSYKFYFKISLYICMYNLKYHFIYLKNIKQVFIYIMKI